MKHNPESKYYQHVLDFFKNNPDKKYHCKSKELVAHFMSQSNACSNPTSLLSNVLSLLHKHGYLTRNLGRIYTQTFYGKQARKLYFYKLNQNTPNIGLNKQ